MNHRTTPRFLHTIGMLAVLLSVLSLPSSVRASIVQALDLDELVADSDQIVIGRVVLLESFQRSNGHIATWHRIQVERALRGHAPAAPELIVETLGGRVGDIVMQVEGEPTFSVDERVLLFLRSSRVDGLLQPIGMGQGVMRIRQVQGVDMVTQSREGMMLMRRSPDGRWRKSRGALSVPQRLDVFLANVRAIVEQQAEDDND